MRTRNVGGRGWSSAGRAVEGDFMPAPADVTAAACDTGGAERGTIGAVPASTLDACDLGGGVMNACGSARGAAGAGCCGATSWRAGCAVRVGASVLRTAVSSS
ncbi:MAG: hypothetical protein EOO41_02520 [Methanobacteriota archaeon]|nr:MAG: hypothetical protein EOO41_02520 [Euryarchaeota archaeon]